MTKKTTRKHTGLSVHTYPLYSFVCFFDIKALLLKLLFFHLTFLSSSILYSQNSEIIFRNPIIPLSDNSGHSIIEDYKGFMWFGTESGLNRYDGTNMIVYSKVLDDSSSLSSNKILSIYETKNNELWIGTASGLNLYSRDRNAFIQFFFNKPTGENTDFNGINQIVEDCDGDLWLATHGGVCILDKNKGKFVEFTEFTKSKQAVEVRQVTTIVIDKNGRVFAGTTTGRIFEFNKTNKKITEYYFDNGLQEYTNIKFIKKISITANGWLWVSTLGSGLFKITKLKNKHIWFDRYIEGKDSIKSISYNYVNEVCDYRKDKIVIGLMNGGLNIFNYKTNTFESYKKSIFKENSLGGNSIWAVYKDKRHRIWIGVFNVGINIIDSLTPKFKSYKNYAFDKNSLTHSSITSFIEDSIGNMWITSDGGGLDYWDRKTNIFTHFKHNEKNPKSISTNAGLCLYRTENGKLWSGFYSGGINILEEDGKSFKHFTVDDGLGSNDIFSIVNRKNGKIYISTSGAGISVYNPETKIIEQYSNDLSDSTSLGNNSINLLYVDSKDRLWIAFDNRGFDLMQEDKSGKVSFIHYINKSGRTNSLSDNTILALNEDKNGNIWVGTRDGLNMLNLKTQQFTTYRTSDGLADNTVVGILEDDDGNLWLSTLNGLSMLNPKTNIFKNFNVSDGLQGQKFNNRAAYYKNSAGEFFFGGDNGFSCFNPKELHYDYSFPKLYIIGFKLFNKDVKINTENSPLKKHITEAKEIVLTYNQSVFTLEYVAINYKNPEKIQYAYMLKGLEKDWNYVGKKRTTTYTNLDPGEYIFKVKCTNRENQWNEKSTSIKIIVLPPWWAKLWFRLSLFALIILILLIAHRIKVRNIQKQKQILTKEVRKRTLKLNDANSQLEEKNEEITQQKEELQSQAEKLIDTNKLLEKVNSQLENKSLELSNHKNQLEDIVKKRTIELETAKEKAEESDRLKSAFLANMSHEIRTPMNAIVGFSQLLGMDDLSEEDKKKFITQININTDSLLELINDILDLSKMESNHLNIVKKEFSLNLLLEEVFANSIILDRSGDIKFKLNNIVASNNIVLFSDKNRMRQVLINLLNNANKFTEKGFIELGCNMENNKLILYVKDSGIGISKDNLNVIFDRFRKVAEDKNKLFRGVGLGLSISIKIAEILGGELTVESVQQKGSMFSLVLPESIIK